MTLSDDDKKYIEGLLKDSEQKTEARMKLNQLKFQDQEKQDRMEYIEVLKKRQDSGTATLSQKVELMKAQISNAIPEDFKEATKYTANAIKGGASQAGQGLSTINRKLMMSNPLTAALYQQRELFGAIGNVAIGTGRMVGGAVLGTGKALAGGVNALFNRKKKDKETDDKNKKKTKESKKKLPSLAVGRLTVGEMLNEKEKETKSKEMPMVENKKDSPIIKLLKKSFVSIKENMEKTAESVKKTNSTAKKILIGILAGAAAIWALKKWFNGDFVNIMNGVVSALRSGGQWVKDHILPAPVKTGEYGAKYSNSLKYTGVVGDDFTKAMNEAKKNKEIGKAESTDYIREVKNNKSYIKGVEIKTTKDKLTPIIAPYNMLITNIRGQGTKFQISAIQMKKEVVTAIKKAIKRGAISIAQGAAVGGVLGAAEGVGAITAGSGLAMAELGTAAGVLGEATAAGALAVGGTVAAGIVLAGSFLAGLAYTYYKLYGFQFNGIVSPKVVQWQVVPKGYIIGFSDGSFSITSPHQSYLKTAKENYMQTINDSVDSGMLKEIALTNQYSRGETEEKRQIIKLVHHDQREFDPEYKKQNVLQKVAYGGKEFWETLLPEVVNENFDKITNDGTHLRFNTVEENEKQTSTQVSENEKKAKTQNTKINNTGKGNNNTGNGNVNNNATGNGNVNNNNTSGSSSGGTTASPAHEVSVQQLKQMVNSGKADITKLW